MSALPDLPRGGKGGSVDISVVIPAYHGAATIADCIESVKKATKGRLAEIIVVESSGDAAGDIVRRAHPDVQLILSTTRLSAGGARNRGVDAARGRLVFFTDQDCIVPEDWIARLERHFADPAIGAAGGSVGIRHLSNLSGCAMFFLEFLYHFPTRSAPRLDKSFLLGCNSGLRSDVLAAVRFPDQTLGEDVLFSADLRKQGFGVLYDPAVEVKHHNRTGWGEFFAYNRKMGRASASYHRVLQRWWAKPVLRMPWLTLFAPVVILPRIGFDLLRSRLSYFGVYLLLLPHCLAGNLVWAWAFRRQVLEMRQRGDPAA